MLKSLAQLITVPVRIIDQFLRAYRLAWDRRRDSHRYRIRLINYTAILLVLLWVVLATALYPVYLLIALSALTALALLLLANFTLAYQRRRFRHPQAGRFEFETGTKIVLSLTIPTAICVLLTSLSSPTLLSYLCYLIFGIVCIGVVRNWMMWTKSWVFEMRSGDICLYIPHATMEDISNCEYQILPPANIPQEWKMRMLQQGISKDLLEEYTQYNCPLFLERYMKEQIRQRLKETALKELAVEIDAKLQQDRQSANDNGVELSSSVQEFRRREALIEQTISNEIGLFDDVQEMRQIPILKIEPEDKVWIIWNRMEYLWMKKEINAITAKGGGEFAMNLSFAVEYKPDDARKAWVMKAQLESAVEMDKSGGSDELISRVKAEAHRQKGSLENIAEQFARTFFAKYSLEEVVDDLGALFNREFTNYMIEIGKMLNVRLLGWSLQPSIIAPEEITNSVRDRIVSRTLLDGDVDKILYLKQQLGEDFDDVIQYMAAASGSGVGTGVWPAAIALPSTYGTTPSPNAKVSATPSLTETQDDFARVPNVSDSAPATSKITPEDDDISFQERLARLRDKEHN